MLYEMECHSGKYAKAEIPVIAMTADAFAEDRKTERLGRTTEEEMNEQNDRKTDKKKR